MLDNHTTVRILYRALLNRDPDPEGLLYYVSRLGEGKSPHEIALEFIGSAEFRNKLSRSGRGLANILQQAGHGADDAARFAEFVPPPTEAGKAFAIRLLDGFFARYCRGEVVLDIGFTGYANPDERTSLPGATGVDLNYPGYDGLHLPWPDNSVDCVFSSHCLEHIQFYQEVIRDWHRVVKAGGFIVCIVPSRDLYEKKLFPPSRYNTDHKRFYTAKLPRGRIRRGIGAQYLPHPPCTRERSWIQLRNRSRKTRCWLL